MKKLAILVFSLAILSTQACNSENNENETKIKSETENASTLANDNASGLDKAKGTINLTKQDFLTKVMDYENNKEWKFEGDLPCIIDFYADWCGPCKIAAPILEELAVEYDGRINIYKVDTQREQELAAVFGIQSIPAFLICTKEGKPQMSNGIGRTTAETKEMFYRIIEDHLLK